MATVVIGGGLLGLSTAQALIDRGEEVLVVEANEAVGCETSFANGGMLTPSLPEPWNGPGVFSHLLTSLFLPAAPMKLRLSAIPSLLTWGAGFLRHSRRQCYYDAALDNFRLARYSLGKTREVADRLGLNFDYADDGTLCVYCDERALAVRLDLCGRLASAGLTWRPVSVAELTEIEPALTPTRDRLVGGIWMPDDARGDAHLYCRELAGAIQRQGGRIRLGARVEALQLDSSGVHSISIGSEQFATRRVVIAAGTGSRALLRTVGIGLPVQPAKGYSITVAGNGLGKLPAAAIVDDATHTVFTVLGGRLRVAGTAEFAGYDRSVPRPRVNALFGALETVLPDIAACVRRRGQAEWAGLRPVSSDGKPFVGPTRIPGLFLNTGHGALGWTMAMGSGHLVADQILGHEPGVDGRPFLPTRH